MKKLIVFLFIICFTACGNDSHTDDQSIIGSWKYSDEYVTRYYHFFSDNTFDIEVEGNYSLLIDSEGGEYSVGDTIETCSGDEATLIALILPDGKDPVYVFIIDNNILYLEEYSIVVTPMYNSEGEFVGTIENCFQFTFEQPHGRIND